MAVTDELTGFPTQHDKMIGKKVANSSHDITFAIKRLPLLSSAVLDISFVMPSWSQVINKVRVVS